MMDLLKTVLIYMSLVFTTSVQNAPVPSYIPETPAAEAAYVQEATATPEPTAKPTPVPTINITPNPAYKTVQMGDNGDLVRQLQEKLAEYGYYDGDIDGRFGNQTRRAVEQFQYHHGLSADGIAGRNTLTVLYESTEIRMAPAAEPTPTATPEMELKAAITPEPTAEPVAEVTAEPAFVPVQTVEPTAEPTVQPTAEPTAQPAAEKKEMAEFLPMEGWVIVIDGSAEPATAEAEGKEKLLPYACGENVYLPVKDILKNAGMNVIATTSLEADEFAFAIGDSIIRVSYTEDQSGQPSGLEAFKDGEPQILPLRDVRRVDKIIYLPAQSIESLTGIVTVLDEENRTVKVTMPSTAEQV